MKPSLVGHWKPSWEYLDFAREHNPDFLFADEMMSTLALVLNADGSFTHEVGSLSEMPDRIGTWSTSDRDRVINFEVSREHRPNWSRPIRWSVTLAQNGNSFVVEEENKARTTRYSLQGV